ncbi:hypothetical protein [uncultured Eubacterium sp.]|uniref:hypothetical protein n=1 Tax=uncultured Eubacterium sp. TaxID=165185 RepID=UPI0025EB4E8D|nr:hypothetical protein [uncultured Eubacterium sp.]
MENQGKKKFISGSKVKVSTVVIVSVVLAVLLALSSFGFVVFSSQPFEMKDGKVNVYELKSKLYTKAVVKALPKKITGNDGGKKIDFYIEENDDYDSKTDQPIEQFRVYYYKDGKKLVAHDGMYKGNYETMYPLVGFFIKGMDNLKALKGVFLTLIIVVCAAVLALLIWLIVLLVRIKQDRQYSVSYQEQKLIKEAEKKAKKENKN